MMSLKVVHIALWATTLLVPTLGRIVDRCDLAHELLGLGAPRNEVSTWVCIAFRESSYNTRAMGPINDYDGSTDHGLFQINDRFWCSPPGTGCGVTCKSLRGDDITPQWRCAQIVFRETQVLKNNGFLAWTTYEKHCAGDTSSYIAGCGILTSDDNQRHNAGQFFGSCARTSWKIAQDFTSLLLFLPNRKCLPSSMLIPKDPRMKCEDSAPLKNPDYLPMFSSKFRGFYTKMGGMVQHDVTVSPWGLMMHAYLILKPQ